MLFKNNTIGIASMLFFVVLVSHSRVLDFLFETFLGRILFICMILFISYKHYILGVVSVLIAIIMFNNIGFMEGMENPRKTSSTSTTSPTTTTTTTTPTTTSSSTTSSPPPPPQSSGAERKSITENYKLLGNTPQPTTSENDLDLNNYQTNYHNNKSMESYYKKMLPPTNHSSNNNYANHPYYKYDSMDFANYSSQDVLLQKLNYMIHLLEEQQDERTNNVTEEVVLYSFLGIFIIFIADSFVRIGKYVR